MLSRYIGFHYSSVPSRLAIGTGLLIAASGAYASSLGSYNALFFGDFSSTFSDTEGSLAVQGTFNSGGYTVGASLPNSNGASDSLIVGGDVNWHAYGSVNNGNLRYGGTADFVDAFNPTVNGGSRIHDVTTPSIFSPLQAQFATLSASLLSLSTSTSAQYDAHSGGKFGISLASSASGIVVFNLDGSKLSNADGLQISATNASTIVINVDGVSNSLNSFGMSVNGSSDRSAGHKVLFNFANTTSLTSTNFGLLGSLLAPNAAIIGNSGQFDGQVIAKSFSGTTQINYEQFTGATPVPEPASVVALGIGGWVAIRRRRRG